MTAPDPRIGPDAPRAGDPRATPGEDGGHTTLRFPGGRLGPADWTALAGLAAAHGGEIHLAPRGVVRIPGAVGPAPDPGLPPSASAGAAPGILASPLAGRLPGRADLGELPEELGSALAGLEDLATLAESVLFGLDDGSGDVLAHGPDLAAVAVPGTQKVRLHVAGRDSGLRSPIADAVSVLVGAAAALLRSGHGRRPVPVSGEVHDLVVVALADHPRTTRTTGPDAPAAPSTAVEVPPVGWIDTADGLVTLLAVMPDGVVPARLAEFLGAIERPSTISADRVIGLHRLTEGMAEQVVRVLAPMGMVFDAASPWVRLTASPGSA